MWEITKFIIILAMVPFVIMFFAAYLIWVGKILSAGNQWRNDRKYKRLCKRRNQLLDQRRRVTDGKLFADLDLAIHRVEKEMRDLL